MLITIIYQGIVVITAHKIGKHICTSRMIGCNSGRDGQIYAAFIYRALIGGIKRVSPVTKIALILVNYQQIDSFVILKSLNKYST